jgi:CBS domain-containing protein
MARVRPPGAGSTPPVGAVMTSRVYSVTPNWSLLSVARLLRNHHISGVPVVDANDHVVGVVSESDLFAELHRVAGVGTARGVLDLLLTAGGFRSRTVLDQCLSHLRRSRVRTAMRTPPIVVEPATPVLVAAGLLRRHRINRLPVVDEGRLVGIVTRQDLVGTGGPGPAAPRPSRYGRGPGTTVLS